MSQLVKVGVFTAICLVILAVLIWQVEGWNPFAEEGRRIDARFDSVAGLDDKAAVRVAGVRVGRVDGVGLDGSRARVTLFLERPLALTEGTTAAIANLGLLGEKYVELIPGPANAPPLPPGAVLEGQTPISIDQAMQKLQEIGESVQQATGSLSGPGGMGGMGALLDNLARTSDEIRAMVAENRAQVSSTLGNFDQVSAQLARDLPRLAGELQRTASQVSELLAENRGDLRTSMGNVRELTEGLQTSVGNLNRITDRISSGQGTLGKLINDEKAHDELVSTLDSIQGGVETLSGAFGTVQKFRFDLDMQGYYLPDLEESQSAFRLDIDPGDGARLYRAGISNTPGGKTKTKTQRITTTNPNGTVETETIETFTREDERVVSALFGYRAPRDLRLWAGLIESSGGAAVELPLLDRRLLVGFDAFDFNREDDLSPHLRLTGRWQFHPNLYLIGGYDDFLENDSLFLGGGIRWTDENLKFLIGAASSAF
jgi:phospholipid/cholesterol/gamma-HCH transport system substrate-binding protein